MVLRGVCDCWAERLRRLFPGGLLIKLKSGQKHLRVSRLMDSVGTKAR